MTFLNQNILGRKFKMTTWGLIGKGLLRHGTELFSVLFSSQNIPYRNFVPRKNSIRSSTVRNLFFPYRNFFCIVPFRTMFFQPVYVKNNSAGKFFHSIFFTFSYIFILLSRESNQCAIRARLGVASHLFTTPRWGNPAKCLSKRHNK